MPKLPDAVDHLDAMQAYMDDMPKAYHDQDWLRLHALAAAAQVHVDAAEFLRRLSDRPTALDGRAGQRWRDAAGLTR